ncbi:(Fe-S)-binding protein [Thermodesulfobacteriota bacterium]
MFDFENERERFAKECTACGLCVDCCPIIPFTDLRETDSGNVMEEVLKIFRDRTYSDVARIRLDSCMKCNTCKSECPEDLDPGLGFCLARQTLSEMGETPPRGLLFLSPDVPFNITNILASIQVKPGEGPWVTDVEKQKPAPAKTVIFLGCRAHMQPDHIMTVLELLSRIDPGVQALGGLDYCCGDMHLRAGDPQGSSDCTQKLVEALNAFSPENAIFLCPTCNSVFDLHAPETDWSWSFATDFLAANLDKLGPFKEIKAKVTIHDACNLVRGEKPEFDSPRKLLEAIPGIEIVEMENTKENALCCAGTSMATVGKPGMDFRQMRLQQAIDCGADVMGLYCTGCQSVFSSLKPDAPIGIENIINMLGESLGIKHEDKLARYMGYHDGARVVAETQEYIEASGLPEDKLKNFLLKYFR